MLLNVIRVALLLGLWSTQSAAQTYPTKSITVVVPFAAGGSVDVMTRLVSERMSQSLGQRIVIENAPGAGGMTGSARVARAEPDGYTLVAGSSGSHAVAYSLYKDRPYKPESFSAIGLVAIIPSLIAVRKDLPVGNLQELIAYAKANPGKLSFGHPGVGSHVHLACEVLRRSADLDIKLVPYRGGGPVINDLMGGQIDAACDATPTSSAPHQAGMIRVIGVMNDERASSIPDVQTVIEQNLPQMQAPTWVALFAPHGTPQVIVDKLNSVLTATLNDPNVRTKVEQLGAIVPANDRRSRQFATSLVEREVKKWEEIVREANVAQPE
jgi:tripartite-type tricarboxylate transporter receptor subunit TctC